VLSTFGVSAEIGKRKDLWLPDGYKISGTASHVSKNRELHHGTLLYETNLEMLEKALSPNLKDERVKAISSVRSKVKNLKTYFEEQKQFTLISAVFFEFLINKLLQYFKLEIVNYLLENEVEKIQQLEESKYKLNNWTFKK
jgi:lipoate-protein ligase A